MENGKKNRLSLSLRAKPDNILTKVNHENRCANIVNLTGDFSLGHHPATSHDPTMRNYECVKCGIDLSRYNESFINNHLISCLDDENSPNPISASESLRSESYSCIVCDINLSSKSFMARCLHLKRCSKNHGISVRDLLEMLSPTQSVNANTSLENVVDISDEVEEITEIPHVKPPDMNDILMANARVKWKRQPEELPAENSNKTKKRWPGQHSWNRESNSESKGQYEYDANYAPHFKKIQHGNMTKPIIVDGFQYSSSQLSDCYFLTHFHSDHYMGLNKSFASGLIYCSATTSALVALKLGISKQYLRVLELERKYNILCCGYPVEVVLTEANHCPGAVCVLFTFPEGKMVFHTGDFRWTPDLLASSRTLQCIQKQSLRQRNLTVYLDTTYCEPSHTFPLQAESIDAAVNCVLKESSKDGGRSKVLFLFGTYAIGKEKIFMSVARAQNKKVYVDKAKWKSMLCYNWPMSDLATLTQDSSQTNLWVVSMSDLNFKSLATIRQKNSSYARVVAFQPTGWTFTDTNASSRPCQGGGASCRSKGPDSIYSIPYSEHSSFNELVLFVETFRPTCIIPTVNTAKQKVTDQLNALRKAVKNSGGLHGSEVSDEGLVSHNVNSEFL